MFSVSMSSGLDVQGFLSQILYAERAPARALEAERSRLAQQSSSLRTFQAKLAAISQAAQALRGDGALEPRTAASSNSAVASANAARASQIGSYDLTVTDLASTSAHASKGYASPDQALTHGSFDIRIGGEVTTIVVDSGSDTLETLRDEIAASGAGVDAVIVNDGTSYRLSLRSLASGAAGAITIDGFTDAQLEADLDLSETSPARDASFTVNGLAMTRPSNLLTDVVDGLSITLAGGGSAVVTVGADVERSVEAIRGFVAGYNALSEYIKSQLAAREAQPGSITNLASVRTLQDQLRSIVSGSVGGVDGDVVNLRQVGIEMQNDGSLTIDEPVLRQALEEGTVGPLFAQSGRATDGRARFVAAGDLTEAGSFDLVVTRAAEQAVVTGSEPVAALGQDETLTFTRGTTSVEVDLSAGMTLAQVVSTVNDALRATGIDAVAGTDGSSRLRITSSGWGAAATVSVTSSTDAEASTGFGTAGKSDAGVDVAGKIGGVEGAGTGRLLAAASGDARGLTVEVRAGAGDIDPAGTALGQVVVSHGVGEATFRTLRAEMKGTGLLGADTDALTQRDRRLGERIEAMDRRLAEREVLLSRELNRADQALRRMNQLLQTLQAQLG
jgi:flagellar hook-associated protein 2